MGKIFGVVFCLFVAGNLLVEEVASECCNPVKNCQVSIMLGPVPMCSNCADNTEGTPYCGYGPCNAFGCNCDGGCRKPGRGLALQESVDGFTKIDSNGDGKVSLEEAKSLVNSTGTYWKPETHMDFARMDVDFDGFLSKDEIDPISKV